MDDSENILDRIHEPHIGIYFADNSNSLTESWQIIWNPGNQSTLRLGLIHTLYPASVFNDLKEIITDKLGKYSIVGETYSTKPYKLANKRIGSTERMNNEVLCNDFFERKNYLEFLKNYNHKPEEQQKINNLAEKLNSLTDEQYNAYKEKCVKKRIADFLIEASENEAIDLFKEFLMQNPASDSEIRDQYIYNMRQAEIYTPNSNKLII